MTRLARVAGKSAWVLAGALVGGALILGAGGTGRSPRNSPTPSPLVVEVDRSAKAGKAGKVVRARASGKVLLAWATGSGLPPDTEKVLESSAGIEAVTVVHAGVDWLRASFDADGSLLDRPRRPLAVPMEVASVDPGDFATFTPVGERDPVLALGRGDVLLSETSAGIRRAGPGSTLRLDSGRYTVSGVVSDAAAGGYEALVARPVPASWPDTETYALVRMRSPELRKRVDKKLTDLLGPGDQLQLRAEGENPFLRYGDAVLPQLIVKSVFGEFAAAPTPEGFLTVDPAWKKANIGTARVPLLGTVTCHRAVFPQLKRALRRAVTANLSFAVDASDFGGCYSPRFINRNPSGRISHHSWGIAVDINVAENAYGTKADQDLRLVRVMEQSGFTWGGRWVVPDGMHFEWAHFPQPGAKG